MDTNGTAASDVAREPDTTLVSRCRAGDRHAFECLVARYQSLVCSVTYSGTGDLGLSQDLAQETFLCAWRGLGEVREPGKLRAWLAGIARNLARNATRRRLTDRMSPAEPIEHADHVPVAGPGPVEHAIAREEEAVLRRALAEIPETYREPLVLFYREQQSIERVAGALELSVDAAKQRLSRGRHMLKAQVAALVEDTLGRTRPGTIFTAGVVAALPTTLPQTAAVGVATIAGKGSTAAAGAGSAGLAGMVFGPLLGVLGGYFGARASIKNARSPRERAFMTRMAWLAHAYVAAFLALQGVVALALPGLWASLHGQLGLCGVYGVGLVALIVWANRRQRAIRLEDGTAEPLPWPPPVGSRSAIYGSLGGCVIGAVAWIFPTCLIAGDWPVAAIAALVATTVFLLGSRSALAAPERYPRIAMAVLTPLAILNLVVVNLRWDEWMAAFRQSPFAATSIELPLWAMNVLVVGVTGVVFVWLRRLDRRQQD